MPLSTINSKLTTVPMSHAFIFIGRSGCGKGTQADLLMDEIKKLSSKPMLYVETGNKFRDFIQRDTYTSQLAQKVNERGERQPDFLACAMWSEAFIEQFVGFEHVIIDGSPRSLLEAQMLETALDFYGFTQKIIIHVDVSKEWSEAHLKARGRADDSSPEKIAKRLEWFDTDVIPAIEYFKKDSKFLYIELHGEQSIESVHADLMEKMNTFLSVV